MYWYWKVRIYRGDNYAIGWIKTDRTLRQIDFIQDFYQVLTGYKMLLEGMSETPYDEVPDLHYSFSILWDKS